MYISNTTVPPTFREPIPRGRVIADKDRDEAAMSGLPTSTVGTPAAALPAPPAPTAALVPIEEGAADAPETDLAVTKEQAEWLRDMTAQGIMWRPFPDDPIVRSGNLMMIQFMLDQGKDPWMDKVPTQQELLDAAQKEKDEEEEKKQREEEERQRAEQDHIKRREAVASVSAAEPQQVQQFTGFDFGDDDD
jgi:hypothetical protein